MRPTGILTLFVLFFLQWSFRAQSHGVGRGHRSVSNITVIGAVFCDICSNNTFTKHSYFLQGAKVQVQCSFRANSAAKEEIILTVDRTTDRFGIYRVDVPPVDGFECQEGRLIDSFCKARLLQSSSSMCNIPGLSTSAAHLAVKFTQTNLCIYNLNALNFRPSNKDGKLCASNTKTVTTNLNSSLFFWPPCPPFTSWPFPPFPFQNPFPFPFPFSSPPPSFPFPFPFSSPTPSLPFPFPFAPSPPPPAFPFPFTPLPPIPNPFTPSPPPPSPPPPSLPFPFPPLGPIPFLHSPPPPSPTPVTPSFPFPFPPFPPVKDLPPPPVSPGFSLFDPRTWFPSHPEVSQNRKSDP